MAVFTLLALTGCSVPDMFGSDDSPLPMPPPLEADTEGNVPDNTGRKDTETATGAEAAQTEKAEDNAAGAEETEGKDAVSGEAADAPKDYPELADVPEGAEAAKKAESTPEAQEQREQLARELASDRERAKYSDEELRGGRTAPVEPPRPAPPSPPKPPRAEDSVQADKPAAPATVPPAPVRQASPAPQPPATQRELPAPAAPPVGGPPPAPHPSTAPRPASPVQVTARAPAQPAQNYSSTAFQPSTAPPLPAELTAALPPGVAQRYNETLGRRLPPPPLPVTPSIGGRGTVYSGGPYVSIPFAPGSARLSGGDMRTLQQVAGAWQSRQRPIRVVGHASSSAAAQSESQRLIGNWQISQARATAVADALMQNGVDPGQIMIEAVGDSQAYGEGEAAARRVDLFLE